MRKWYKAKTLKEIFYQGKTYRQGSDIKVTGDDVKLLVNAGVIGAVEELELDKKEYAIKDEPEVAMRKHGKRGKGK